MFRAAGISTYLIFIFSISGFSQQVKPNGYLSKDTVKIGEPFQYSLSAKYPRESEILFPDSTYDFSPFELLSYNPYPTKSDSIVSFDSTVYELATYEIDSIQYLTLPVFIVESGDSTVIAPTLDSIILYHAVVEIPDSITMKSNTDYNLVSLNFNYPYFIIGFTIFLVIGLIILIFFGKSIRKKIRLYRLNKLHKKFLEEYKNRMAKLESNGKDVKDIEFLLWKWKDYMELLKDMPYTKLTTKEINQISPDKELNLALNEIDKAIYSGKYAIQVSNTFEFLRRVSEDSFNDKVEEIKNG